MGTETLAGILLVAGPLIAIGWNLVLALSGRSVSNAPRDAWPDLAPTMRWTVSLWLVSWLLGVGGLAMLATVLDDTRGLSALALVLLLVAMVFAILEGTHHLTIGIRSATAATPEEAAAARVIAPWASGAFQTVFYTLGMAGLGVYGGAIVLTDGLADWPGWIAVGVAVAGLALLRGRNRLTWALVIPVQLAIGMALLVE